MSGDFWHASVFQLKEIFLNDLFAIRREVNTTQRLRRGLGDAVRVGVWRRREWAPEQTSARQARRIVFQRAEENK